MGTIFRLVIWARDAESAGGGAEAAWKRIDQLNETFSDYDPSSELSRLCRQTDSGPMTAPLHVSEDLWDVLSQSVAASRLSGGTFDITVGPLSQLQRRMRKTGTMPTTQEIEIARQRVGWRYIKLDPSHHGVQLLHANMRLDVGGIAKGYTSEQVLKVLRRLGFGHALCGAAGDIYGGDPPPGRDNWHVGIQSLKEPDQIAAYVQFHNYAVSTSGDTYRGANVEGTRYSHIIDPRTGLGITRRIGVTTLAPHGITADWITKPISILGPRKGIELIEKIPGAAARVVEIGADGVERTYESKRFGQFIWKMPALPPATHPLN